MKNTFHQVVTLGKHPHHFIATSSQYHITKVLINICVGHFTLKLRIYKDLSPKIMLLLEATN